MALCIDWQEENPPVSPFFKGGSFAWNLIPLFEKKSWEDFARGVLRLSSEAGLGDHTAEAPRARRNNLTTKLTKDTKGSDDSYSELRALRVLRGENLFYIWLRLPCIRSVMNTASQQTQSCPQQKAND